LVLQREKGKKIEANWIRKYEDFGENRSCKLIGESPRKGEI
jgi:hypothetical protein